MKQKKKTITFNNIVISNCKKTFIYMLHIKYSIPLNVIHDYQKCVHYVIKMLAQLRLALFISLGINLYVGAVCSSAYLSSLDAEIVNAISNLK